MSECWPLPCLERRLQTCMAPRGLASPGSQHSLSKAPFSALRLLPQRKPDIGMGHSRAMLGSEALEAREYEAEMATPTSHSPYGSPNSPQHII